MEENYVYILFSEKLNKFYVGQTMNFENRLIHHNARRNKFTSMGVPWKFIYKKSTIDKKTAILLETKIKKRGIRRYLDDIKFGM